MSEFPSFFIDSSITNNPNLSWPLDALIRTRNAYISTGEGRSTLEWELFDRAERQFYKNLCQTLWEDFKGAFLFSGTGSLYFKNLSIGNKDASELKIGHWDYMDCAFLVQAPITNSEKIKPEYLERLKSYWIKNPEMVRKNWAPFIRGINSDEHVRYLEYVAKRSKSIRFIKWWVGTEKPECVDYGSYDLSYAESSQWETRITCNELISLVKIWGRIIIGTWCYSGSPYIEPLIEEYSDKVRALIINPEGRFHMFERAQ